MGDMIKRPVGHFIRGDATNCRISDNCVVGQSRVGGRLDPEQLDGGVQVAEGLTERNQEVEFLTLDSVRS